MPAKFHGISPAIWDRTFRDLGPHARDVAFYIWSCPARTYEGFYRLPVAYIVADTGQTEETVLDALRSLSEAGLVDHDQDSETVLDRVALKHNPIRNGVDRETGEVKTNKRIKGALTQLHNVADSPLFPKFLQLAESLSPDLAEAVREEFPDWVTTADIKPLPSPLQDPSEPLPRGDKRRSKKSSYGKGWKDDSPTGTGGPW